MRNLFYAFFSVFLAACGARVAGDGTPIARDHQWSEAAIETLASLPLQEGGRVKPLSTFAAYTLYMMHGRRDMKLDLDGDSKNDVTLSPSEWLLDVWSYPRLASEYWLFRIENVDVLDAIGIEHQGQRFDFDYVSFRDMVEAAPEGQAPYMRLFELSDQYGKLEARDQSPVESHIVDTAGQVNTYFNIHQMLQILADSEVDVEGAGMRGLWPDREKVALPDILEKGSEFTQVLRDSRGKENDPELAPMFRIARVLAETVRRGDRGPALFPPDGMPSKGENETWLGLSQLIDQALFGRASDNHLAMARALYAGLAGKTQEQRETGWLAFRDLVVARATARGEFSKVELETSYNVQAWHYKALHWFLFALLVVAIGWILPRSKLLWMAGIALTALPLGFLIWDITLRSLVRDRPPITNLYDTFLFIASTGVLAAIVAEIVTRRRIAIMLAPMFGALLIMLARWFEVEDGKDQMAPLQAVLDTNYYLAIHVTTINMGYAAGMFAALLGTTWLVLNAIGFRKNDPVFHKQIVRATYGVTAFGLVFSVFGTIYGGVWANDSWGRFWGWDPKENGALMICLAMVTLMHARMVGWVRDFGFCVCAGLTGIIVAFSWFHVNLLQIGLHSYGFSSGIKNAVFTYYEAQGGLVVLAAVGLRIRQAVTKNAVAAVAQESGA